MGKLSDESATYETIINRYARTWTLLLQYDENSLERPKEAQSTQRILDYDRATQAAAILKNELVKRGEASDLFGRERDRQLEGILGNINQTFDGRDLYPNAAEKAACLLYFIIKDHPFADGNKRIGSLLFLLFLDLNGLLEQSAIKDNGLVSLALLIAESDAGQKDLLIRLVMNLLVAHEY